MDAAEFRRQRRTAWDAYTTDERERAIRWKQLSADLPDEAREDGPYSSRPDAPRYPFCLPTGYADHNLLTAIRSEALDVFRTQQIVWHKGVDGGPTSHLLSSQVQCVNALAHLLHDEGRLRRAFGGVVDIGELVPIEDGRLVTFEYVGPEGFDGLENGRLSRGANCTSVDAAFQHRGPDGRLELVLVEWKYTERYSARSSSESNRSGDATRARRYLPLVVAPGSPVRDDVLTIADLLSEPFYQLMRQQLLASALEGRFAKQGIAAPEPRFDRVVVVHVAPAANAAYQLSLNTSTQVAVGSTVSEVWDAVLRDKERFVSLDSAVFLDPTVTSPSYVARYGEPLEASL
jgi:hypothetical protein